MGRKKRGLSLKVFLLSLCLCASAGMPARAQEQSGESSLSERISALESELAELEAQVGIQTGAVDDSETMADGTGQSSQESSGTAGDSQSQSSSGQTGTADPQTSATESDPQQFLDAVVESFNKRRQTAASVSADELASMSEEERVSYCKDCVDSELGFYQRYRNALFSDKNLQYYCHVYRTAIEQQESACAQYEKDGDGYAFNDTWYIGYYNRTVAVAGLTDVYGAGFDADAVEQMREDTGIDDVLSEQVQANAGVDHDTVVNVQTILNKLGFSCGEADGICGLSTVRAIRHFQALSHVEITGLIDSELVSELSAQSGN